MKSYFVKRLLLIPLTLFLVLLVNFILINCMKDERQGLHKEMQDYLESPLNTTSYDYEFREHYGLDLPLLVNLWPFKSTLSIEKELQSHSLFNLKASFVLKQLQTLYEADLENERALQYLIHGAMQKVIGKHSFKDHRLNSAQTRDLVELEDYLKNPSWNSFQAWIGAHEDLYQLKPSFTQKLIFAVMETRTFYYFKHLIRFDFGTLREDISQSVPKVVFAHFKTSLLLLVGPLLLTFVLSQLLGMLMALRFQKKTDFILTFACMVLYALPLYVVIPLLIEKVGIPYGFPIHGGLSTEGLSFFQKSNQTLKMLFLPYLALTYGALALYSRFNKTLFLHLFNQPHLKVAKAKGLGECRLLFVHTLRQAFITLVPLFLGAIGTFLSGLILVENLFEIRGFGFLFYQAMIQKDYHVLLFSTLFASFLSISGYFLADLFINTFDPRIRFNDPAYALASS